ncbi:hypothetical protein G6F56_008518 [Rhizopus delemar]|uniref:UBA domain-containing protein n=1 Tax=Rhizopus stolonifer TaxID=4846 RepID=A0A367IX68_RHIST|nr:hypothetical protein G6F56_008518 [Rhizopus delemar]RCH82290.1 hypothetical protein CU098_005128 [Rhizopus stolonifer]
MTIEQDRIYAVLVNMGFNLNDCRKALNNCDILEEAIEIMLSIKSHTVKILDEQEVPSNFDHPVIEESIRQGKKMEISEKEHNVNERLMTWTSSQENNLRNLLSSLQHVIWSELQWETVSPHNLLEPIECKRVYKKAISKIHPDKLHLNASVEQRLLANGIFSALHQAWDNFRKENSL